MRKRETPEGDLGRDVAVGVLQHIASNHGGELRVTVECSRCGERLECSLTGADLSLTAHRLLERCARAD